MKLTIIDNQNHETTFDGLTPMCMKSLHFGSELVQDYEIGLTGLCTMSGKNQMQESKVVILKVSEFRLVINKPEAIKKAIDQGRSFYVSLGCDHYSRNYRNYAVYLGKNDFEIVEKTARQQDMGDSVYHYIDIYLKPLCGGVAGEVYDHITHGGNMLNPLDRFENPIQEQIAKIKNPVLRANLEKAQAAGDSWVRFAYRKLDAQGIRLTTYAGVEEKPDTIRRKKLAKSIKENTGVSLSHYQIQDLEKNGYKIVKTRK